jgi:hypothetical protein
VMGVITHARPLTFGTYPSDSLQPGLGPVDPTSNSASHSGPGPLADTMCIAMTWEAKARARHRLESSLSESLDSDGDGVSPVVDGSGPM